MTRQSSASTSFPFSPLLILPILALLRHPCRCQQIESVSVLENSPIDTVVYDLRERLFRINQPEQLANVSAYAGQQDLFWPFALKNLKIVVARPLDREEICEKYRVMLPQQLSGMPNDCPPYHCCQLLHVNVAVSPVSPTKVFFIRVAVQDVNDNAPIFPRVDVPFITIPEDIAVGERIPLPEATDADSPPFGVVEYRISRWIQGNGSHFHLSLAKDQDDSESESMLGSMQPRRPYLRVVQPLDRESVELYEFVLEAVDGGERLEDNGSPFVGMVNIVLRIRDVNDNAPQFGEKRYNAMVKENTLPRMIFQFKITDKDAGENSQVFVNVVDPTFKASSLFRVSLQASHPQSPNNPQRTQTPSSSYYVGSLHLLEYLDAEKLPPTLKFYLVASDNGNPALSSNAEVVIEITNVNDQAPHILFLREGKPLTTSRMVIPEVVTAPETIVAEVHVSDADTSLGQLTCRLASGGSTFSLTEVSAFPGLDNEGEFEQSGTFMSTFMLSSYRQYTIRTKVPLDRERQAMCIVTVTCTDNEPANLQTSNASLHISISDVNDETPLFEHAVYQGRVRENEVNAPVTKLSPSGLRVFDRDVGRNALITYSLKEASENASTIADVNRFRIDPRSGRLWSNVALDAEDVSVENYSFYVVAMDDGFPDKRSSSALINIIVDDMNDNQPEFRQYHYNFEVLENSPVGTVIGSVSVHDADKTEANRRVRYALRGLPEDLFMVEIDRSSGQLTMRRPVDFEKQSTISLTAVAENEVPLVSAGRTAPSHGAYHSEASIMLKVINVNDNRPEFVPISPHRKHFMFTWEHLPAPAKMDGEYAGEANDNADAVSKQNASPQRICEPIPYKVIDKDCDPGNQEFCCNLSLENTFDGTFGLMEEIPNMLCALKRPPQPQSYKVTLVASDGKGNDSLSSQIQLSVIIKSGPEYGKLPRKIPPISTVPGTKHDKADSSGETSSLGVGGYRSGRVDLSDRPQAPRPPQQGAYEEQQHYTSGSGLSVTSSSQLKIISVLVSVAGILCVLLLFVAALKCGLFDGQFSSTTKPPENVQQISVEGGPLTGIPPKHGASILNH